MNRTYEAMFLLDASSADFEAAAAPVREVLARAEAEVLSLKPWDERRLAYQIKGRRRGLYVLTYFQAEPSRITELQHEIQLNEKILRAMLLSADHASKEQIQAETPATAAAARRAAADARSHEKAAGAKEALKEEAEGAPAEPTAAKADAKQPARPPARRRRGRPASAPEAAAGDEPAEAPAADEPPERPETQDPEEPEA